MCLLFQGTVSIKNSPSVAGAKRRSLTQLGTDWLQWASVNAVRTWSYPLYISVSVLSVKQHTLYMYHAESILLQYL